MTEDRIKLPCLDEKGIHRKRIFDYQQWLDRFKQYTKRKYEIDIGPLFKEETMTGTECNTKEEKIQQDFLWALEPEATRQITGSEYETDPDIIKIDKLIKLYNRYNLPKKNTYNSRGHFFGQNKQIRKHRKITGRNYSN